MKGFKKRTGTLNPLNAFFHVRMVEDGYWTNHVAIHHNSFFDSDDYAEVREIDNKEFNEYFDNSSECSFSLSEKGERTLSSREEIQKFCLSIGMIENDEID